MARFLSHVKQDFQVEPPVLGPVGFVLLVILAALLCLTGCNKASDHMTVNKTTDEISSYDLRLFLTRTNNFPDDKLFLGDSVYMLPDKDWLLGSFARDLVFQRKSEGLQIYESEANDCDKYALHATSYLKKRHALTVNRIRETGIAGGMFWYDADFFNPDSAHAIFWAVCMVGGRLEMVFIEPQGEIPALVSVSREQIDLCHFAYF